MTYEDARQRERILTSSFGDQQIDRSNDPHAQPFTNRACKPGDRRKSPDWHKLADEAAARLTALMRKRFGTENPVPYVPAEEDHAQTD
jgi:hypothetical protein